MTWLYLKTPSLLGFACSSLPLKPASLLSTNSALYINKRPVLRLEFVVVSICRRYGLWKKRRFRPEALLFAHVGVGKPDFGLFKSTNAQNKFHNPISKSRDSIMKSGS